MNLLVTGGCGFIGSNFINNYFYKNKSVNIVNLDAMYYCASEENVFPKIRKSGRYHFVKGNLVSKDLVNYILDYYKINYIIHFAAQSHVDNSFDNSLQYTTDNIVGTHTLLDCCKGRNLNRIIHVSTDEVYGESLNDDLKNESSILIPTNPYAATKGAAELIAISYIKSYSLPIIITRGNNVYGPNQYPEKLIPRFIKLLKNNEPVTIQGDGSARRSFLHVDDVCDAFNLILEKGVVGEIYNIGAHTDSEYTVKEIAEMLIKKIKGNVKIDDFIEYVSDRPFNDSRYYISNDKLINLGWKIKTPFKSGIKRLIKD